jgi:hypothetical protein
VWSPPRQQKKNKGQQLQNAQKWFLHVECNSHPQSVIFTHTNTSVILTLASVITTLSKVWFIHTECNFNTQKIGFYTQSKISHTHSKISIRKVLFYSQNCLSTHTRVSLTRVRVRIRVNMTLTSVISTRWSVIPTRRVLLIHAVWF